MWRTENRFAVRKVARGEISNNAPTAFPEALRGIQAGKGGTGKGLTGFGGAIFCS
jgi:hypothetical protein